MLHAASVSDVQLVGFGDFGELGGTAAIQNLQQALTSLSIAAGWPAANPGPATGEVTPQTVQAMGAVIGQLAGLSTEVKTLLAVSLAAASINTAAMGAAKSAIASQAVTLQIAVMGLIAKYTKSTPPPAPPPAPMERITAFQMMNKTAPSSAPLPVGSFQAQTRSGNYRVVVPEKAAAGLGGPAMLLGESFFEIPSRPSPSAGAILVTEKELDNKLKKPFYKRPLYWAAIGGVVVAGYGAFWMIRR